MQSILNNLVCTECGGHVITAFNEETYCYEIRCYNPECNHVLSIPVHDFMGLYNE